MNWKRLIIAGVAGFVALFAVLFVWHIPIFGGFYNDQLAMIARTGMIVPMVIIMMVIQGFVMSYIYPLGYKGGPPAIEGAKFGLAMGLFTAMTAGVYFARFNFSSMSWFWMELIFFLIQGAIAGAVIGMVYGSQSVEK